MGTPFTSALAQRYPHFLETIARPDTKFVLSLGSGGVRLFGHPSVMMFLDALGAKEYIDEIWGCSGGAVAGFSYALGISPIDIEQLGDQMYRDRNTITLAPTFWNILRILCRGAFSPEGHGDFGGFLAIEEGFRRTISKLFGNRTLQIPSYSVAFNIVDRRCNILTPMTFPHDHYLDLVVTAPLIDVIMASSAIPILYTPKRIQSHDGERIYLDGSITESVPLLSVYRKWLLDRKLKIEKRPKLLILAVDTMAAPTPPSWLMQKIYNRIPMADLALFGQEIIVSTQQAKIFTDAEIVAEDHDVEVFMLSLPLPGSTLGQHMIPSIIQEARVAVVTGMDRIERSL